MSIAETKNMGMISGYSRINEANWVQFGKRCGKCVLTRFWPKRQICGKPGQEFPNHEFFEPKPHLATSQERMTNFIKFDPGSPNIRKSHLIQSSLSLFTARERAPTTSSIQTSRHPFDALSGPDSFRYERQTSCCQQNLRVMMHVAKRSHSSRAHTQGRRRVALRRGPTSQPNHSKLQGRVTLAQETTLQASIVTLDVPEKP